MMGSLKIITIVAVLAFYCAIGWAVAFHFRSKRRTMAFQALTIATLCNISVCLFNLFSRPTGEFRLVLALLLIVGASALFFSAIAASHSARLPLIYDKAQPDMIIETGPYRYIRHPFYVGYVLFWLGCAVATLHIVNVTFFLVALAIFVMAAKSEEKSFAETPLASGYGDYKLRAGFLLPRFRNPRL